MKSCRKEMAADLRGNKLSEFPEGKGLKDVNALPYHVVFLINMYVYIKILIYTIYTSSSTQKLYPGSSKSVIQVAAFTICSPRKVVEASYLDNETG